MTAPPTYGLRLAKDIVPKDVWRIKQSGMGQLRQVTMSVLACWNWASIPFEDREPEVMIPGNPLKVVPGSLVLCPWSKSRRS